MTYKSKLLSTLFLLFCLNSLIHAQSEKNLLQATANYVKSGGLGVNLVYERAISDRHRVSIYGSYINKYTKAYGLGYKAQILKTNKWELFMGLNIGVKSYDLRKFEYANYTRFSTLYYSPNIEARYNINQRFQAYINVSKDIFVNKNYYSSGVPSTYLGVGYKF
jgi:hypothetical protein